MMQAKVLQSPRWLPVIVWAACILFTLTVWRVLRAQERKQTEHLVESSLANVSTRISAHIDGSLRSLTQMAKHWQRQDNLKQVEWEADTQAHIAHEPGYVCIGWVDTSRDLRWISPGSKEKAFREHILRMDDAPAQVLWESLAEPRMIFAGGLELERDRRSFLIAIPVFSAGLQNGCIVGVIGIQEFMDTMFGIIGNTVTWVEISEGMSTVFRNGEPPGRDAARWVREAEIDLHGMRWNVRVLPSDVLLAKSHSILPDVVLTVGTLMACLVALTVYLGYTAGLQARELQHLNTELETRVTQRTADLREANERLQVQTRELAQSNDDLQQFAYVASHDMQEPLRMVSSYMQLIQRRYRKKLDKEGLEFMHFAVNGAERMRVLINELLEYARLDTASKPPGPIPSGATVRAAIENLELVIKESGAMIDTDPMPTVLGDGGQLTRLFQNLIGNAIKFKGDRTPHIRIHAERVPLVMEDGADVSEPLRRARQDAAGAAIWHFAVKDNGIGIDPTFKERIFIIFQRLHGTGQYPGTGLGLAICKKVVERHGGRIWVESETGKGSTFHFTLREALAANTQETA